MRRLCALPLAACLYAACGGSSAAPLAPTPIDNTPLPPIVGGTVGRVIDAISDAGVPNLTVRVDGMGDVISGPDGGFVVDSNAAAVVRNVTLTSPATVQRVSQLVVPGPAVVFSVMSASFDLAAFDQMFRTSGRLQRWITPPRLVVQRRVLAFTSTAVSQYQALADVMSDAEAALLVADLRWALPQVTGGRFTGFVEEQHETAAAGESVLVARAGSIVVAQYSGLTAAIGFSGFGRWATDSRGAIVGGIVMLDRGFETSGSQFRRSLRTHELGHGLGYQHVTLRASFMNSSARVEPNAFDRDATNIAFQRQAGSRSPDLDPDGFTANAAARSHGHVQWTAGLP